MEHGKKSIDPVSFNLITITWDEQIGSATSTK